MLEIYLRKSTCTAIGRGAETLSDTGFYARLIRISVKATNQQMVKRTCICYTFIKLLRELHKFADRYVVLNYKSKQ